MNSVGVIPRCLGRPARSRDRIDHRDTWAGRRAATTRWAILCRIPEGKHRISSDRITSSFYEPDSISGLVYESKPYMLRHSV
jgi:hypothetical protein